MTREYVVKITDRDDKTIRQFVVNATHGRAMRAGYEAAEFLPAARAVKAIAI